MSGCVLGSGKGGFTLHTNQVELMVDWLLADMEGSGQNTGLLRFCLYLSPTKVSVALRLPRATVELQASQHYTVRPCPKQTKPKLSKSKDVFSSCLYVLKPTTARSTVRGQTPACPPTDPSPPTVSSSDHWTPLEKWALLAPLPQPAGCRYISLAKAFLPEISLQISSQQAGLPASGCPILTL